MTSTHAPFPVASGTQLLGEVISWTCAGVTVTHAALMAALKDAGLDENVAHGGGRQHRVANFLCRQSPRRKIAQQVIL